MTQELRKLAKAATQGKRHYWVNKRAGGTHVQLSAGENDLCCRIEIVSTTQADIEFIAAANPAAILALLDRVEKAEKDAERYRWFADIAVGGDFDKAEAAFACFEHSESCTKDELDAAIDRAMEADK